ncbi:Peroxidase, family 2-domain-containing protein [Mycena floridula]|nr:Peroxidase, family 2-domain-containing protein [Mycena floridula]
MYFPSLILVFTSLFHEGYGKEMHQWRAPGPNDLRSPCPAMNTMANHGYIPRDGRGLTAPIVVDASFEVFNFSPEIILPAMHLAFLSSAEVTAFTLQDITRYNVIEHDASLSRADFAVGDNVHFNETIFQTLANSNPGVDYYNGTSAGLVMRERLQDSVHINPKIINTKKEFFIRTLESGFYLSAMGDPKTGIAPKKFVQIFFRQERLPIEEGWKRPSTTMTFASFRPIQDQIEAVTQWTAGPGDERPSVAIVINKNISQVF